MFFFTLLQSRIRFYRVSRKKLSTFADCVIAINHPNCYEIYFPCSQKSNFDHKPFPRQNRSLDAFLQKDFLQIDEMLQTNGILCQAPFMFHVGKRYRCKWYYLGRMRSLGDGIFSPECLLITCPTLRGEYC